MTDLERLLMQQLLACEADLHNAEAVHAKNSARMSEVMQNALARADGLETTLLATQARAARADLVEETLARLRDAVVLEADTFTARRIFTKADEP